MAIKGLAAFREAGEAGEADVQESLMRAIIRGPGCENSSHVM